MRTAILAAVVMALGACVEEGDAPGPIAPAPPILLQNGPELGCEAPDSAVALICSGRVYLRCSWTRSDGTRARLAFAAGPGGWRALDDAEAMPPGCPQAL